MLHRAKHESDCPEGCSFQNRRRMAWLTRSSAETIIGRRESVEGVTADVAYPSTELILDLHEQIVEEGDTTKPGIRSVDAIESALQYVSEGSSARCRTHSTRKRST